ncbi:hypothetical protein RvY_11412-2 [Ramazzottius varieornatus]|uniref:Uncharacterized protein n=1 Tax=Ramazzottius varieornatus TaxID=947166 RepID=A0A1D1VG18_RAMVA|nr:hypothetical protein RvY_11412-2 [Ramazzottius varieornatus]
MAATIIIPTTIVTSIAMYHAITADAALTAVVFMAATAVRSAPAKHCICNEGTLYRPQPALHH